MNISNQKNIIEYQSLGHLNGKDVIIATLNNAANDQQIIALVVAFISWMIYS